MPSNQDIALRSLKQELQILTSIGTVFLLLGFSIATCKADWLTAGQWLLQAGLLWGFVCRFAGKRLSQNRAAADTPLYNSLGWGNRLTLLRGGLIALTGGFLFIDLPVWPPALLYALAALLDRADGYAARRGKQVSLLGNELDISFDALGLVVAPLLAIGQGKLHASYLLLSAAYYVYQWALLRRRTRGLPIYAPPPNSLRRALAGFQMAFIAVALLPFSDPAFTRIAGTAFMLPVLFGFVMDWLVICGSMRLQTYNNCGLYSERLLQPGLRIILAILLLLTDSEHPWLSTGQPWLLAGMTGLILLGIAGRLGALILLFLLDQYFHASTIPASVIVLVFASSWLLLLGTGRFSLQPWGEDWIQRYDGA
ncbi:CDP-alcohol phosphatidyltransferase family protein [Methylomonas sp. SURF-2]|uniref:CDP-alcohol phosphatidyltransferase family protein n=1 Tax=Methylomonas subterranea TaxID=2952225 RepID=A0ABT1TL53_9GAMM|nr:CDP-alcohol phosphatidyltransferase family protein [Methylomonas sp. SURF-2]MCQ8106210.1 CDP-alcohol phosphatidyltransferase family protein [Methylomonas sp. SURF-2]